MNYRKIYEQQYGPIPKDNDGRTYDIHHIDGNRTNNSPENLKAVTIKEHYNIHYSQGDWGACLRIAEKMDLTSEEISKLATKNNLRRIDNGTHNFLGGEIQRKSAQQRIANGTHHFLGENNPSSLRTANGTHHFLGGEICGRASRQRVADGIHNLLGPESNRKRIKNGTHNFITNNPTKVKVKCLYCSKEGSKPQMKQWHFDNCKKKPKNERNKI